MPARDQPRPAKAALPTRVIQAGIATRQEAAMSDEPIRLSVTDPPTHRSGLTAMSLAALGVVFGDIGTSPLYTLKTVLDTTGAHPSAQAALGSLSLIVWTLIIV